MVVFACIAPHPPIILPEVGSPEDRRQVKKTIEALELLAPRLAASRPDVVIISSPHPDWGINVPWRFLGEQLVKKENLPVQIENYYSPQKILQTRITAPAESLTLYPIITTPDPPAEHYQWGRRLAGTLPSETRIAIIASGDMSHRLKVTGPYGFHPSGPKFDREFIRRLEKKDIQKILNFDPDVIEQAAVCGLWSFCLTLGFLDGSAVRWQPEIISYEGPFGVGYLVADLKILS